MINKRAIGVGESNKVRNADKTAALRNLRGFSFILSRGVKMTIWSKKIFENLC